jgi:hypothetical protein
VRAAGTQYNAVYIPVELCFSQLLGVKHNVHIALDFFVDFLFLCDIGINFRTVLSTADACLPRPCPPPASLSAHARSVACSERLHDGPPNLSPEHPQA